MIQNMRNQRILKESPRMIHKTPETDIVGERYLGLRHSEVGTRFYNGAASLLISAEIPQLIHRSSSCPNL